MAYICFTGMFKPTNYFRSVKLKQASKEDCFLLTNTLELPADLNVLTACICIIFYSFFAYQTLEQRDEKHVFPIGVEPIVNVVIVVKRIV